MKRAIKTLSIFLSAILLLAACSSDDNDNPETSGIQIRNFANSGCKKIGMTRGGGDYFPGYPEYIEYKGMEEGHLSINHVNTAFNCEPGELKIQATLEGNVIIPSLFAMALMNMVNVLVSAYPTRVA